MMGERVTVEFEEDGFFYNTEFSVHPDCVQEIGTPFKYDPATKKGYQTGRNGQRIALTSYAAFGSDLNRAHEAATHWCQKAQRAYDMVYGK
jgi:hypothetical protein